MTSCGEAKGLVNVTSEGEVSADESSTSSNTGRYGAVLQDSIVMAAVHSETDSVSDHSDTDNPNRQLVQRSSTANNNSIDLSIDDSAATRNTTLVSTLLS